jgi:predicted DNA-binding WGR domain protein
MLSGLMNTVSQKMIGVASNEIEDDQSDVTVEIDTGSDTDDGDGDVTVEIDTGSDTDDDDGDVPSKRNDEVEEEEDEVDDKGKVTCYLECTEGNSGKFYEIILEDNQVTTSYGRIGSAKPTTATKDFDDEEDAQKFFDKTRAEKIKKGYIEADKPASAGRGEKMEESQEEEEEVKAPKKGGTRSKCSSIAPPSKASKYSSVAQDKKIHAYLECEEGSSFKFYELEINGSNVTTTYGRIGTSGSQATKDYGTVDAARKVFDQTLKEKLRKGYDYSEKTEVPSLRPPAAAPVRAIKAHLASDSSPLKPTTQQSSSSSSSGRLESSYLVCKEGNHNKFYEIMLNSSDNSVYTRYGKIGTSGMESKKEHSSYEEAKKFYDKTYQEKIKKGYHPSNPADEEGNDHILAETKELEIGAEEKEEVKKGKGGNKRGRAVAVKKEEEEPEEEELAPKKKSTKGKPAATVAAKSAATSNSSDSAYLECVEGTANKFYKIWMSGNTVISKYGRIGTSGQETSKSFNTHDKAKDFLLKTISEKCSKGYKNATES